MKQIEICPPKMRRCRSYIGTVLALLVGCMPAIWAQDGFRGALRQSGKRAPLVSAFGGDLVAGDFDNDKKPDGAVLLETGQINGEKAFRIEFHLTARENTAINFLSAETRLVISTLDVNRDGAPDVVVEKAFTHKRLKVYLNDGHGTFQNASPEAFPGPDESAAQLRARVDEQNLPTLFMPAPGGFELAQAVPVPHSNDADQMGFWPEGLVVQCGARAPSGPRAPPSFLFL
jgi:hypothetical protein